MGEMFNNDSAQLGFDNLLASAETDNRVQRREREAAHLPGTMGEAVPFYAALQHAHHLAMMKADSKNVTRLRNEARLMAQKLNGFEPGYLSHDDAPGYVLQRTNAAPTGEVPIWGQCGAFAVEVEGIAVKVTMEGMLGICSHSHWLGFGIHAVDWDRPFLSETGYRSFLGVSISLQSDIAPDEFVKRILTVQLCDELRGKPVAIASRYHPEA